MSGEFGQYVNAKRKGRGPGGDDILLRDLAKAMGGISVSYLSDILKGRRNPPEIGQLELMAQALSLTPEERDEMLIYNLAFRQIYKKADHRLQFADKQARCKKRRKA